MAPARLLAAVPDAALGVTFLMTRQEAIQNWAMSTASYLVWVIGTTVLPVPSFGISAAAIASAGIASAGINGTGLWVEEPARLMAGGAGYFLTQAWLELRKK